MAIANLVLAGIDVGIGMKEGVTAVEDPSLAIEYSAAIIDVQAERFEHEAEATRREIGSTLGSYNVRDRAGLLSSFYQGVDPENAAEAFETRRLGEPDSKPRLPEADASMGPWVSQYRDWISELIGNY